MRYTVDLSRSGPDALRLSDIDAQHVQQMDSVQHIADLKRVGQMGARQVKKEHFEGFFEREAAIR
jgi:hypothetical protein